MLAVFVRRWLPLAVAVTVLAGTVFTIGQQILRQGANDPQVQFAEEAAARLQSGARAGDVIPTGETDIGASLAPWVLVYGPDRRLIAGSAQLDGRPVEYPTSVFDNAPAGGRRHEVTWQPRAGVRAATIVVGFKGGWVVAGRSLRLVEERADTLLSLALAGWLAALAGTAVLVFATGFGARRLDQR